MKKWTKRCQNAGGDCVGITSREGQERKKIAFRVGRIWLRGACSRRITSDRRRRLTFLTGDFSYSGNRKGVAETKHAKEKDKDGLMVKTSRYEGGVPSV